MSYFSCKKSVWILALLSLLVFCACSPQETSITATLDQATAIPTAEDAYGNALSEKDKYLIELGKKASSYPAVPKKDYSFPDRFKKTVQMKDGNKTTSLELDIPVITPDADTYPVIRAERIQMDDEEALRIIKACIGSDGINPIENLALNTNELSFSSYDTNHQNTESVGYHYEDKYSGDVINTMVSVVRKPKEYLPYIRSDLCWYDYTHDANYYKSEAEIPIKRGASEQEFSDYVAASLEKLGLQDYTPIYSEKRDIEPSTDSYRFIFSKSVDGHSLWYTLEGMDRGPGYEPYFIAGETVEVYVDNGGINWLMHSEPMKNHEILIDNVELLPFEKITAKLTDPLEDGSLYLNSPSFISRIQLQHYYVCDYTSEGKEYALYIPAWEFVDGNGKTFMLIDAVDGQLLEMANIVEVGVEEVSSDAPNADELVPEGTNEDGALSD